MCCVNPNSICQNRHVLFGSHLGCTLFHCRTSQASQLAFKSPDFNAEVKLSNWPQMLDLNASEQLFMKHIAHPSSPPSIHGKDVVGVPATDVRDKALRFSTHTEETPTESITSKSDSNDLSISSRQFEEVKMADNCKWDEDTVSAFISIMQENKDELTSSTFKPAMWNKFSTLVYNRTGLLLSTVQISTNFQRLRIEWRKYNWLLKQTGLGIDPQSGAIIATDEQWKALERMQEGVSKFRRAGLPLYEELIQLFNKFTAIGNCARSANVAPPNSDEEREQQQHLVGDKCIGSSFAFGQYRESGPSISTEPSKSSGKRKYRGISFDSEEGSSKKPKGTSAVDMLTQLWAAKELKKEAKNSPAFDDNDPYSIPKCMEVVNAMTLEPELYYRAIQLFCDRNMRQTFMTMLPEMCYGFLSNF